MASRKRAPNMLILVAEDDPASRELIAEILRGRGYDVLEAADGAAAIAIIADHRPDLVVVDIEMPVADGFAVLNQLRALPGNPQIPVLAVTAHAMLGDRERALAAGFSGYLAKPIEAARLRHCVDVLLHA